MKAKVYVCHHDQQQYSALGFAGKSKPFGDDSASPQNIRYLTIEQVTYLVIV